MALKRYNPLNKKILLFNYRNCEDNFYNFSKNNKCLNWAINLSFAIIFLLITWFTNPTLQKVLNEHIFNYFGSFTFSTYLNPFFAKVFFLGQSPINSFKLGTHDNYQFVALSASIIMSLELTFLVIDYFYMKKKMDRFILSHGVDPDIRFQNLMLKDVLIKLISTFFFLFKTIWLSIIFLPKVFTELLGNNNFENNWYLFMSLVFLIFWMIIGALLFLNYATSYYRFVMNFSEYKKNNEILNISATLYFFHFLLELFIYWLQFTCIFSKLPVDLFIIWVLIRIIKLSSPEKIRNTKNINKSFIF